MAVSKANQRAVNKYVKNNYDRINVTMPKGKKDAIQSRAEAQGQSVNAYINTAIDEKMSREAIESSTRPTHSETVLVTEDGSNVLGHSGSCTEGAVKEPTE